MRHLIYSSDHELEIYTCALLNHLEVQCSTDSPVKFLLLKFSDPKFLPETDAASKWVDKRLDNSSDLQPLISALEKILEMNIPKAYRTNFTDIYKSACHNIFKSFKNYPDLHFTEIKGALTISDIIHRVSSFNVFRRDKSIITEELCDTQFLHISEYALMNMSPASIFAKTFSSALQYCKNYDKFSTTRQSSFEAAKRAMSIILECNSFAPYEP